MLWAIVTICSYFLAALSASIDQYLLQGKKIPNPKLYTFYAGVLGFAALFLIPFGFSIPDVFTMVLNFGVGVVTILFLFSFYRGVLSYQVSTFIPAFGGLAPIFTVGLNFLMKRPELLSSSKAFSFLLLVAGTIFITSGRLKTINVNIIKKAAVTAFLFSLYLIFSKLAFERQPFWSGFIWMRFTVAIVALCLFFSRDVRGEIFNATRNIKAFNKRVAGIFLCNQGIAAGMILSQNFAIAIVPPALLAFIGALLGTEYVFLLIFGLVFAVWFPKIFPGEPTLSHLLRKIFAIFLIVAGLVFLSLS